MDALGIVTGGYFVVNSVSGVMGVSSEAQRGNNRGSCIRTCGGCVGPLDAGRQRDIVAVADGDASVADGDETVADDEGDESDAVGDCEYETCPLNDGRTLCLGISEGDGVLLIEIDSVGPSKWKK